jgi:hypothetical protein
MVCQERSERAQAAPAMAGMGKAFDLPHIEQLESLGLLKRSL